MSRGGGSRGGLGRPAAGARPGDRHHRLVYGKLVIVAGVNSVTAGDASIVIGGTATDPTVETGTLDVIASLHPPAANWSNNSKKITSLANGTGAQDAAAFGQIPTSASQIGGVTSVTAADTSIVVAGTAAAPTIATATLDVIAADHPPAANWSNNSHKITALANGSAASDAAAFGQIPVADTTAANILIDGSQAAGANGKWADSGHVHPVEFGWQNTDQGLLGQTFDVGLIGNSGALLTSGTMYLARLHLGSAQTITNILCAVGSAASGLTTALLGLYNSAGTLVASTADRHADAAWTAANTLETAPLSATFAAGAGLYWVAILLVFSTTSPGVGRLSVINSNVVNAGLAAGSGNLRMATYTTGGQTSLPASFTPTSQMAADNHLWWFGLS